jgi:hypothetical protein
MMTAAEIQAWDERRREELDRETGLERLRTRRVAEQRKARKEPPTPERIQEVSEAVLRRRMDAISEELRRRRNQRSPETVARKIDKARVRRKARGMPPGFEGMTG